MRMRGKGNIGLTLVELLIAVSLVGMLTAAAALMLDSSLKAHTYATESSNLTREGTLAMERMTSGVRNSTYLLIPNAHKVTREILAFSGMINDDNDFYFGDPLFPRIDEDPKKQMVDNSTSGLENIDDDGDGLVDEGDKNDDDEDGLIDEDPLDGLDNDGDGNIDEDLGSDANSDGNPGISGIDDDGDGQIDEGSMNDNDEDNGTTEDGLNPVIYTYDAGANTLTESFPETGEAIVLSDQVIGFSTFYEPPDGTHAPRITISLTLAGRDGEPVPFVQTVYPRNVLQKTGKKVR